MGINLIGFAVPFFLFFIGWEYWHCRKKGKDYYHFPESIANLNVGIAERLTDVFTTGFFYYLFRFIYEHFALFTIKPAWYTCILLFLLTDLVWYWYHRLAHEVNVFWAVHVVHHQSEDFNYTAAARITIFQAIVRSLFWSVLPLIGFPPEMITLFLLIHGLYPFFTHTQTIGRLGWVEYLFVTPSHHRVHHASNEEYLDKNYGDVLIIWDKLFGTFVKEGDQPIKYGLTTPLGHYSFLWQHFHFMLELGYAFIKTDSWRQRWKLLFGRPDNLDSQNRDRLEAIFFSKTPSGGRINRVQRTYIMLQTGVTLLILFLVCLFEHYLRTGQFVLISCFIIVSLINTGAILEQKKWVFYLEYARFIIVLAGIGFQVQEVITIFLLLLTGGVVACFFKTIQQRYYRFLFEISK